MDPATRLAEVATAMPWGAWFICFFDAKISVRRSTGRVVLDLHRSPKLCHGAAMPYRLQFRRYRLPLRGLIRTAHEVWTERQGFIVRLEDEAGRVGFGEAAPIPAFGTETIDEADALLREIGTDVDERRLTQISDRHFCVRHALATAVAAMSKEAALPANAHRGIAALLPAGQSALGQIATKAEIGFRVFKWKVGVGDPADELALLDDVCAALPQGSKLRLDANGAWDRRRAERWLERCAERPVEFVEQPCFAPVSAGTAAQRHCDDLLRGLAAEYPTPIALDESLVGGDDVERWLTEGWPGWFVVKPSLLADPAAALARLEKARSTVVFSSALETAVGARSALRWAFRWSGEPKALGFGVWPLFSSPTFDGPAAAPFIRSEDVERIDVEAVWNALS